MMQSERRKDQNIFQKEDRFENLPLPSAPCSEVTAADEWDGARCFSPYQDIKKANLQYFQPGFWIYATSVDCVNRILN